MPAPKFIMRAARGEDVVPYTIFLGDREVSRWLDDMAQRPLSAAQIEQILLHDAWCLWAIECGGRFAGVTSLYEPDTLRGIGRFSIVIGDKTLWGRGLGAAVTRKVLDHAFGALGLRKVNSDYLAPNKGSAIIHDRLGFVEEGRLRADAWREGRWVDRIILSILADEWTGRAQ
ncbi:MAG TPA: GNAT family protein [Alphaproteobacteria bacterium]|nr:GNAT family protein [Alphaproteobacteria bacterium]